ncbi:ATP-dependent helicase [Bacillus sp. AFS096315]|uniref:ATP-dependent helicase n=1 Tax=Bacillus sp. AFS096315 TaxID=2033517 RepID=UPI000BEE39EA|nr:ATP-dependent helicase [Bacillus sp. AFS096315]PEC46370.1 DNA helicase [Bacillus sp. AFS096315]
MNLYLQKLKLMEQDEDQLAAFYSKKSTIVKAGPGSGKTTVLTLKIMKLLNDNIKEPRGLGCITYSKEAAREFKERLKKMGYRKRENVVLGTVHSFCISQILIPFAHLFKDEFTFPLSIITEGEVRKIFDSIIHDLELDKSEVSIEDMENYRSHSVKWFSNVEFELKELAAKVATEYEKKLKAIGKTDFTEIIRYSTTLINREEYIRKCLEAKFPWILVDEYQDFGKPLHELILSLINLTKIKIFAVGDPDQSIYSFNGAFPDYFFELYDDERLVSIELKTNYRSNQDIIDASSIALNIDDRQYKAGTRVDEKAQFHFIRCKEELKDQFSHVIDKIIPQCIEKAIPYDEICILVKDGYIAKNLASEFEQKKIPYYFSKFDFSKSDFVLWLKDCASWVTEDSSYTFTELSGFWTKLLESYLGVLNEAEKLRVTKKLYTTLQSSKIKLAKLTEWLTTIEEKLEIKKALESSPDFQEEVAYYTKLKQEASTGNFKYFNVKQFSEIGKPKNQIAISTRHSSKGLEFEVVIMLGMEQGVFPDYRNNNNVHKLNEERRVFFVCVTRAKSTCYLLMSNNYTRVTRYGVKTFAQSPSIFWNDLFQACQKRGIRCITV